MKPFPLAALAGLLLVVAVLSFVGGLAVAGAKWRAKALYAADQAQLERDTGGHLDQCVDALSECRAGACPAPVKWGPP